MTVVIEPHPDGFGWRWRLLDCDTGELLLTGVEAYSRPEAAETVGQLQLKHARTLPTPDHLEPA